MAAGGLIQTAHSVQAGECQNQFHRESETILLAKHLHDLIEKTSDHSQQPLRRTSLLDIVPDGKRVKNSL